MDSKSIVDHSGDLPVPREDDRRDLLLGLTVIVICASICGAEKWNDIEAFGHAKESWLRRSHDEANGKSAIQMVSAWASRAGLTLAQGKVDKGSSAMLWQEPIRLRRDLQAVPGSDRLFDSLDDLHGVRRLLDRGDR